MLRVVESAAIAAAHTMGQGDRKLAEFVKYPLVESIFGKTVAEQESAVSWSLQ
jgi:fructose-1,6-bisphosphatase/sedoheptulose 1,7-bisphosphatase-like protein